MPYLTRENIGAISPIVKTRRLADTSRRRMPDPMQKIRLSKSSLGPEEHEAASRVLNVGYLGMGEETHQFEQELAALIGGQREVVCVNTGTSALHLAVSCLDIGPADERLVPTI